MKARPEAAISPTIGVILLIFLTVVLVGAAALVFFGFSGDLTEPKHAYITAETTDNATNPLVLRVWDIGDGTVLKDLVVSVNTPEGVSIGTPTKISNAFYVGETIPIEFDDSFPKGSYLVTVTGEFADGANQVLFTKIMDLGADGRKIQEVSTEKLFLMADYAYWKPNKLYLTDTTPYKNILNISYWTLDLGYSGVDIQVLSHPADDYSYTYPTEAFNGTSQTFVITYTAYYIDGKSKTTVQKEVQLYVSEQPDQLGEYVKNYKIGGESLQGTGDSTHHIPLVGILATTIWREDIDGRYIIVDGEYRPALQVNLNDPKEGASSVSVTSDTEFRVGSTYFAPGETYAGTFSTFYLNTANRTAINVTLKIFDASNTKLAEQTTLITIRD
ncbi:hypothetical protein Mlab_1250 [Methanocorpusculum labreanum Z]|uniref:Archaeal Type IV pilin N-terminal domain-containing protein n=1 Tax=Methanocorpusculum labreanum (strain ATCC 43576 / DSM 4855 / Z) TaxID=410358 RepID=A2SSW3_METLZ|nr:type IV pilin N-terminal domain-containing protein [Methanocorpusculum labreanum]ABN07419.1 hypothetical protein Mlab_1250 [Methanocorpusculum labreanum Z]